MLEGAHQRTHMWASWRGPALAVLKRLRRSEGFQPLPSPSRLLQSSLSAESNTRPFLQTLPRRYRHSQAHASPPLRPAAAATAGHARTPPSGHPQPPQAATLAPEEPVAVAATLGPASAAPNYLSSLSEEQVRAVTAELGATRVVAGPGSGKTRVLISRIAHLLYHHKTPAFTVLAITFTNKAAEEMRERLVALLGQDIAKGVLAGTFHSFCHRLLRRELHLLPGSKWDRDFSVYDQDMAEAVVRRLVTADHPDWPGKDLANEVDKVHRLISAAKNKVGSCYRLRGEAIMLHYLQQTVGSRTLSNVELERATKVGELIDRYQAELAKNNALDFDDLLGLGVALLRECPVVAARYRNRFRHLLVDEFQDTNSAQYLLVKLLAGAGVVPALGAEAGTSTPLYSRSVFVVGDPDQAIYGWRGADTNNMRSMFEKDFPHSQRIDLQDNYRSAACILRLAQRLISHNRDWDRQQLQAKLPARNNIEVRVVDDDHEEARYLGEAIKRLVAGGEHPEEQIAVLFRTHVQSRLIEQELVRQNVRYVLVGGLPFWRRMEVQDVLAYLRLGASLRDDVALERVVNVPKRALGPTTVAHLRKVAKAKGMSLSQLLLGRPPAVDAEVQLPELPDRKEMGITPKAAEQLQAFRQAVADIRGALQRLPLRKAIDFVMKRVGYWEHVESGGCSGNKDDKIADRLARLHQLLVAADDYEPGAITGVSSFDDDSPQLDAAGQQQGPGEEGVGAAAGEQQFQPQQQKEEDQWAHNLRVARNFLDEAALYSGVEEGGGARGVRLMTMHAAKGLEFEAVFVAGCNDDRLPLVHKDTQDLGDRVREERRLFFVSITRAKQRLVMVHAQESSMYGPQSRKRNAASRFLFEALGEDADLGGSAPRGSRPTQQQGQQGAHASQGARAGSRQPPQSAARHMQSKRSGRR